MHRGEGGGKTVIKPETAVHSGDDDGDDSVGNLATDEMTSETL